MLVCPRCGAEVGDVDRFCSRCGAVQAAASLSPTVEAGPTPHPAVPASGGGRFPPGSILGGRYRIVGPLGRGGMGEVFRADDLKLGTTVAVKVLSRPVAEDSAALGRLVDEVRHAREVSHPNVCRVHDIGEAEGVHFLTMEYVDGENLAVLLRRIGRLPGDKAVEIARQICAGLSAAHDKGLLHRDLKPENVMLDGRGAVRITDFGLAVLEGRLRPEDLRSGTPAYMAPEQLEGREATVRSDLFSLGLIVQEMVTGKRVFDAATPEELGEQRRSFDPLITTDGLGAHDPVLERVVRRCLDPDPAARPRSARAVAAALPGGDPLAAALEAGETPSPDLVAAAGSDRAVSPRAASLLLAAFLAALVGVAAVWSGHGFLSLAAPVRSAEALAERSRETLSRAIGDRAVARDEAYGFNVSQDALQWVERQEGGARRWDLLKSSRLGALAFWYRAHPRTLKSWNPVGVVTASDPPPYLISRSSGVLLDEAGRLVKFYAVPDQVDPSLEDDGAVNWSTLLDATGIPAANRNPARPSWLPPLHADSRVAWTASVPELPGIPLRIEAASYRGVPVYLEVVAPWTRPTRMEEFEPGSRWDTVRSNANLMLLLFGIGAAIVLAWRNARLGRGDQRGATRMALGVLVVYLVAWAFRAHHQFDLAEEWDLFLQGSSIGLFLASLVWLVYLALEPMVRRRMPHALISWTRLLGGSWRDSLVGRDVLLGATAGAATALVVGLSSAVPVWLGLDPGRPYPPSTATLRGARGVLVTLLQAPIGAILTPALLLFLLAALRQLVRRNWVAGIVLGCLLVPLFSGGGGTVWLGTAFAAALVAIWMATLVGSGFLSFVTLVLVFQWLAGAPWTLDPTSWLFPGALAHALAACLVAGTGFALSVSDRPLLR